MKHLDAVKVLEKLEREAFASQQKALICCVRGFNEDGEVCSYNSRFSEFCDISEALKIAVKVLSRKK